MALTPNEIKFLTILNETRLTDGKMSGRYFGENSARRDNPRKNTSRRERNDAEGGSGGTLKSLNKILWRNFLKKFLPSKQDFR